MVVCTIGANVVEVLCKKIINSFLGEGTVEEKNMIQATIGEDVAVEGFVDPDPLQNPPLFSFKSTYSPSGIVSI